MSKATNQDKLPEYTDSSSGEKPVNTSITDDRTRLILDSMPLGYTLWNRHHQMLDCNEATAKLFGFESKEDCIARLPEHLADYQSDSRRSIMKARKMLDQAFEKGYCHFEWDHQLSDGKPVSLEVTLTRIQDKNDFIVAAYSHDLRGFKKMRAEIERQNTLLLTVNSMSIIMLQSDAGNFNGNLLRSMNVLSAAAGADRVYVWKNHNKNGQLYCSQIYEWSPVVEPQQDYDFASESLYSDIDPEWESILSQGQCINGIVRHMSANAQALLSPQGILSILVVPIFLDKQFWGFVGFDDCHNERTFAWDEENILRSASELIANALIRNEEAERARQTEERVHLMLNATPLGCVLLDSSYNAIDCNNEAIKLIGAHSKTHLLDNFFGFAPEYQPDGQLSAEKAFLLIEQTLSEGTCQFEWTHLSANGVQFPVEVTCVRVEHEKDFVIASYARDLRPIRRMEKSIVQLESKVKEIYDDSLTGIYNRRFFDENLERIVKTLARAESLLSVLMIDIDHFKQYNDTYGHVEGDICLKRIAQILKTTLSREDDFVARYGGEEFGVVLPNTGVNGARIMAQRLLENVQNLNIPHETSTTKNCVTISIGVVTGKAEPKHHADDYIRRADEMLYESKQNGRNTYRSAGL